MATVLDKYWRDGLPVLFTGTSSLGLKYWFDGLPIARPSQSISVSVSDSISTSEHFGPGLSETTHESISVVENVKTLLKPLVLSVHETISVTEQAYRAAVDVSPLLHDNINTLDVLIRRLSSAKSASDSVSVSEHVATTIPVPLHVNVFDTISTAELDTKQPMFFKSEIVHVSDVVILSPLAPSHNLFVEFVFVLESVTLHATPIIVRVNESIHARDAQLFLFPELLGHVIGVSPYPISPNMNLNDYWVVGI